MIARRSARFELGTPRSQLEASVTNFLKRSFSPPPRHEFAPKAARLTMRLPEALLAAVKAEARRRGLPYQRLIRETLERATGAARAAGVDRRG